MSHDLERQQRDLLLTIIKLTNIVVIASVVFNSYFLLTDFWPTLAQNVLSLSIFALGLWCHRLASRGQTELAVRLYLSVAMVLLASLLLVLSPPFLVNSALALALMVLIASYLDTPSHALRWGAISIGLYCLGLTVRLIGPFEKFQLAAADLVALYLLPSLALVLFTLLGRSATGRLVRALGQSEASRRELEQSHGALRASEAALTAANKRLQLELAQRQRVEEELRRSLEETARGQRLLLALSHAAQNVQQARTPEEVYRTVGDEIRELGYGAIVLRPDDAGEALEIAYVSFDPAALAQVEDIVGSPVLAHRIRQAPGSMVRQVVEERRTILSKQYVDFVIAAFPEQAQARVREMVDILGLGQSITAPLSIADELLGLLIVTGPDLSENDRRAVSAFASQAAIALTNVRLLQEVRQWASELEVRVEERTAELAASEARYRRLFDSNHDALYVIDLEGHILDANPAAGQLLGYDRQELLDTDVRAIDAEAVDAAGSDGDQFLAEALPAFLEGLGGSERTLVTRDGARIPAEVSLTPITYQGDQAVLAAVRDITDRKRAEAALRRSQEETLQNHQRLLALSQTAQAVQRAGGTGEVYELIGRGARQLGFQALVLSPTQDPTRLVVTYWTFDPDLQGAAEELVGSPVQDVLMEMDSDEALHQLLDSGKAVYFPDTAERIGRGLPSLDPSAVDRLVELLGVDRSIYAPLRVRGENHGILVVAGCDLNESDVPAVAILANQAGIAMENALLLEEQRENQARMQRLAREVVSAQEQERQRISHILHDESGQALTALKISLELIAQDLSDEHAPAGERILDAAALTDSTMERIRLTAQGLRPPALDTIGLGPTLENLCQDFSSRTHLSIDYRGAKVPALPEPVSITMYRFLQEALTNVARHSRADHVDVQLEYADGGLALHVEDNGEGFDLSQQTSPGERRTSMGLEGMRERLVSLGGRLEISSQPGQGTRLTAVIPRQVGE